MNLSSWVVGSLVFVCLVGCSGASRSGAPHSSGEAGAGDSGVSNGGGIATNGGSSNTNGGSSDTNGGGSDTNGGGSPEMTTGGAEGGSSDNGPAGAGGRDLPDPCVGVVCESPPGPVCDGASALKTYDATGSCVDGACRYVSHSIACACESGACNTDPCLGLTCTSPPAANCKEPNRLVAYAAAGTCAAGSCSYPGTETVCDFGCSSGACKPNPCASVVCNQPPVTACKDASTKITYAASGSCSEGSCSYAATETACTFGCYDGACLPDPCFSVTCDAPPSPMCESPTQLRTFDKMGSCAAGVCGYTTRLLECSCQAGACAVDPCQAVTCESAPAPICKDPATLTTYAQSGTCKAGSCGYAALDKPCAFGCEQGACKADPCVAITCNQPPAGICKDATTKTTYAAKGSCSAGNCSYAATDSACAFGCENGACRADPCVAVTCSQPPAATCKDATTKTTYAAKGSCSAGNCSYAAIDSACAFGCENGACRADPCAAVACDQPPAAICKDSTTKTIYAATGSCNAGSCSYTSTDASCGKNQLCEGAGECFVCSTDSSCGQSCTACSGATPKCKLSGLTSKCVACVSDADCGGANPKCNITTNVCGPQPSCLGLAKTCGPNGDRDCCASGVVTGGNFNRINDANYPATVSDFRLDDYEITVGRFRKFVAAYQQDIVPASAGRNPSDPSDTGWDSAWNEFLPADKAALAASLECSGTDDDVWQDSVGSALSESLPLPCLSWLVAEAFCIWDGGRLPTEAEWNYAAAGGNEQRLFPWGSAELDCSHANYDGAGPCADGVNRVGSESPLGDGLYGQSDLAGNLSEWTQDWYADPYSIATCDNCADHSPSSYRVMRGGAFIDELSLSSSSRSGAWPYYGSPYVGARCARMP